MPSKERHGPAPFGRVVGPTTFLRPEEQTVYLRKGEPPDEEIDPEMLVRRQPADDEIDPETLAMPQPTDDEIDPKTLAKPQPIPHRPVVTIYVRKGDHPKERTVSISPVPEGVDPLKLLDAGFALDGNSATLSVDPYTFAGNGPGGDTLEVSRVQTLMPFLEGQKKQQEWIDTTYSLTKALASVEKALVTWLIRLGFGVKFG